MSVTELRPSADEQLDADLLAALDRRPVTSEELVERLAASHPGLTVDEAVRSLQARGDVLRVEGGWVSLLALAEGAVLTHVLTRRAGFARSRSPGDDGIGGSPSDGAVRQSRCSGE